MMRPTMEELERRMAQQSADLVKRATQEAEGPRCIALVERIVRACKRGKYTDYLTRTSQWQGFKVLYPVAADRLEKELKR
jgi:hypothetical protein